MNDSGMTTRSPPSSERAIEEVLAHFNAVGQEKTRHLEVIATRVDDREARLRSKLAENQRRPRKESSTDNRDATGRWHVWQQRREMRARAREARTAAVHDERRAIRSSHSSVRESSHLRTGGQRLRRASARALERKPGPVDAGTAMMLDVIAVVEEQAVVKPAVVARRAARVLEVSLQET